MKKLLAIALLVVLGVTAQASNSYGPFSFNGVKPYSNSYGPFNTK